jgi:hypothetical protein
MKPALTCIIAMFIAGCSSVRTIDSSSDLHALVGQYVRCEGRFDGPGKEADFVVISDRAAFPNGEVYLTGNPDFGGREISYGSIVTIEGELMFYQDSKPNPEEKKSGHPLQQTAGDFFFIGNAKVSLIRPPGIAPK